MRKPLKRGSVLVLAVLTIYALSLVLPVAVALAQSGSPGGGQPGGSTPPGGPGTPGGSTPPDGSGTPGGSTPPGGSGMPGGSTPPGGPEMPGGPTPPGGPGMPDGSTPPGGPGMPGGPTPPGDFMPTPNPEDMPPMSTMQMPEGMQGAQGLFGPRGPVPGESSEMPDGAPQGPPADQTGVFGGKGNILDGGIGNAVPYGHPEYGKWSYWDLEFTVPPVEAGWALNDDGTWSPPLDWIVPVLWEAPEGWQPGDPVTLEEMPWNKLAVQAGNTPGGEYIPGTLVRLPSNVTLAEILADPAPNAALGINLPSFMEPGEFQKVLRGEVGLDHLTQEMMKALNPGKFGPMQDPFVMSRSCGLSMDASGNMNLQMTPDAPGNSFMMRAKELADQGMFQDALSWLNDPDAPFNQFPDALIHTWKSDLADGAGDLPYAMDNMEKALALAPFEGTLYEKVGELYKKAGKTDEPSVFVNGVIPEFDVEPYIDAAAGRTMVPFRALAEAMGADVGYIDATRTVTMTNGDNSLEMTIGSKEAVVNGVAVTLDVAPQIVGDRTVVPLRFVSENLDSTVEYYDETRIVKVLPLTK